MQSDIIDTRYHLNSYRWMYFSMKFLFLLSDQGKKVIDGNMQISFWLHKIGLLTVFTLGTISLNVVLTSVYSQGNCRGTKTLPNFVRNSSSNHLLDDPIHTWSPCQCIASVCFQLSWCFSFRPQQSTEILGQGMSSNSVDRCPVSVPSIK